MRPTRDSLRCLGGGSGDRGRRGASSKKSTQPPTKVCQWARTVRAPLTGQVEFTFLHVSKLSRRCCVCARDRQVRKRRGRGALYQRSYRVPGICTSSLLSVLMIRWAARLYSCAVARRARMRRKGGSITQSPRYGTLAEGPELRRQGSTIEVT